MTKHVFEWPVVPKETDHLGTSSLLKKTVCTQVSGLLERRLLISEERSFRSLNSC